jgi:branched-chain amino acid transport system substrate-binding protein
VKVALITSLTGGAGQASATIPKGFAARIDAQNAAGGVNGRKITYIVKDDQTSPDQALTAAQAAVNDGAFAIDYNSAVAFGAIRYMTQNGIPVVGGAYDGPEWSQPQTYPNMFSWTPAIHAGYKYQGFSGVPNFGWTEGYASADLLIKGLLQAGVPPVPHSLPICGR